MAAWRRAVELSLGDADLEKLRSIARSRTIAVSACHLCQLGPLGVGISQQPMHSDCNEDDEQRHDVGHEKYYPKPHVDPLTRADRQAIDDARCRHGSIG
jgi:hypothetical protein